MNKKTLRRVTVNNYLGFFRNKDFRQGEYCTYQFERFLWMTIQDLAAKAEIVIKYCPPGSYGYKTYGDSTFRVFPLDDFYGAEIDHPDIEPQEKRRSESVIHTFDPATLMI